jgi:hypothetical protein
MPQLQKKDIDKSAFLPDLVSAEALAKEYEVVVPTVYKWVNKRLIPVWRLIHACSDSTAKKCGKRYDVIMFSLSRSDERSIATSRYRTATQ